MRSTRANDIVLVCSTLLIAIVTAAAETDDDDWGPPINITEFLDTNDNIWTVITTANDSQYCKVDKKNFINRTNILFYRKFRTPQRTTDITKLLGKFRGFGTFKSMELGPPSREATSVEELIYQGKDNICGVFELRNLTTEIPQPCYYFYSKPCWQYRAFDIRVRGSGGQESAKECSKWFRDEYPQETFTRYLYNSSCERIVTLKLNQC
ncbi:uncharacterized protein LOC142587005 [Dermacentor variabilis]|uniref:uncharacterized protein LOC142587005 n=1 Tax=Dermacentor variabilis TaxID=34621 RepID=UPI003F5C0BD3